MELSDDSRFSKYREGNRYHNVRTSIDNRSYLGKSYMERNCHKRPNTSLTL